MKKYYSAILMTAAALSFLFVAGFQKSGRLESKTDAPQNLQNEKAIQQLKRDGSFDSLSEAITRARYKIERGGGTLSAENPANRMTAQFDESGALQLSGATQNSDWQSVWKLKSLGRGARQSTVGGGRWQSNENRAELRRDSIGLTEYFENRPTGLEQGFILSEKPAGDENLRLVLQTSGELKAMASADGQTVYLSDQAGAEVLRYDKLKVWDAEKRDLTARMTTDETGEILLEVEDANAAYPLTIDPTFFQRQKLTAGDGTANDYFGSSVAVAGETAIVGASSDGGGRGAAYIFVRHGSTWTQQAKLVASDGQSQDHFGGSVAISSNETVVIGASQDYVTGVNQGSAYVFVRSGTSWTAQEKLVAADGTEDDWFGSRVAIYGETIVVGAIYDDVGSKRDQGSAYVFVRSGGAWTQQAKLTASDGTKEDWFGFGVAIEGSMVIIGAPRDNDYKGSAYIFTRSGNAWTQSIKLLASDGAAGDWFGWNVDLAHTLSGTIAAISAPKDAIGGAAEQGSVYIFNRASPGFWSQTQKLTAADGAAGSQFGYPLALSSITGNTLIIGAKYDDESGAAYVFKRSGSVWTQTQKIKAFDSVAGNWFGHSLALSGETVIVSSPYNTVGSNMAQGAAYIFKLGISAFDFDDDGKTDISMFRPSNGQWSYYRSSDSTTQTATLGNPTDRITPADYTGDGKTDFSVFTLATASWYIRQSENNTTILFQFGQSGDIPMPADYDGDGQADPAVFRPSAGIWRIKNSSGGTTVTTFGNSGDVPAAADYDGDGRAEIAIFRPTGANGAEWWYLKSSDGQTANIQFGVSTDKPVPGDYTGDGQADIAVWRPSTGEWFILRSEDGSFFSVQFGQTGDLPSPGDYDGDGRWDAAVFRPSNSTWYLSRSTLGNTTQQFGLSTDRPVPNAFVP